MYVKLEALNGINYFINYAIRRIELLGESSSGDGETTS
jgi:hypothetical protein